MSVPAVQAPHRLLKLSLKSICGAGIMLSVVIPRSMVCGERLLQQAAPPPSPAAEAWAVAGGCVSAPSPSGLGTVLILLPESILLLQQDPVASGAGMHAMDACMQVLRLLSAVAKLDYGVYPLRSRRTCTCQTLHVDSSRFLAVVGTKFGGSAAAGIPGVFASPQGALPDNSQQPEYHTQHTSAPPEWHAH